MTRITYSFLTAILFSVLVLLSGTAVAQNVVISLPDEHLNDNSYRNVFDIIAEEEEAEAEAARQAQVQAQAVQEVIYEPQQQIVKKKSPLHFLHNVISRWHRYLLRKDST